MPNGVIELTENLNNDSPSITWVEDAAFSSRYTLAFGLIGGWQSVGGFLIWVPPARYVYLPGLACQGVDIAWNGSIKNDDWDLARFTVTYGMPEAEEQDNVDIGELALDVSAEMLALPKGGGTFTWFDGPDAGKALKETDITPQLLLPMIGITLKRKLPTLQLNNIVANIGSLNSSALIVRGYSFPAELVMFTGAKVSRKFSTDGNELWDYDLSFVAKNTSWNEYFHKDGFHKIDPQIYGLTDHNIFFN